MKEKINEFECLFNELKNTRKVEDMMLVEARTRKYYYQCFNIIMNNQDFWFNERSKRPPKDSLNALISFGNTMLYNEILRLMWQTSLNPQIGIIHAANRRNYSLHLDFADVFKPIIVDRVVFSLVNGKQINKEDFIELEDGSGGIYLNTEGKRIFVKAFETKLESKMVIKNREYSYRQLIFQQLQIYQKCIMNGSIYRPYKYY